MNPFSNRSFFYFRLLVIVSGVWSGAGAEEWRGRSHHWSDEPEGHQHWNREPENHQHWNSEPESRHWRRSADNQVCKL